MSTKRKRDTGPPATGLGETDVVVGFLDYLRDAIAAKVEGVDEAQARAAGVPSGTSLLGLVKHLTYVERSWVLGHDVADWQATFKPSPDDTVDTILAAYRETITEANKAFASWDDLTEPGPRQAARGRPGPTRRWTLVHLIEETGRHAGHADILRELTDGTTGR